MPSLTRDEAAERAALLTVDGYTIDLDLTRGATEFGSTTVIRFRCDRPGAATFAELRPIRVHRALLNGRDVDVTALDAGDGNRLRLYDLAADNELTVHATMAYSNTAEGLHRFVDPADGEVYLYAQTCLDSAQRVFTCFDQPDLKAPLILAVTGPQAWTVLANSPVACPVPGRWEFAATPPLSTYLMTLVAGPYRSWYTAHDGIGLGIHCRAALADHLDRDADEVFGITAACFDRYHEVFGVRYPFGKYDQVFVPEFNVGAMENPGCVTFRDEFVFRSAVTEAERTTRAMVIAHEMAHMWFGNLVTMRWWDDLWLNEAFAEYLGVRVAGEATRFADTWSTFTINRKTWGYAADQRPSTHPVAPDRVDDCAAALLNFDGISYAKGASAVRQLAACLGDDAFFAGLRRYFDAYRFRNATLADLLTVLGEAGGGRDLTGWALPWLRATGVTTLRPVAAIGPDGRYTAVTIVQTAPPERPTLRPHRLAVGLYDRGRDGRLERRRQVCVDLEPAADHGRTPVPALTGEPVATLFLTNDDDLSYAKVRLADAELEALPRLLPAVVDPLARAMLWSAAWDATRDADLPADRFLELVVAGLPTETELAVFAQVVSFAVDLTADQYLGGERRPAALAALAAACARTVLVAEPGSGRQLAAARGYVRCATVADVPVLRGWLAPADGDPSSGASGAARPTVPDGLTVDAELRWAVLRRLVVLGAAGHADIDAELDRDHGAAGAEQAAGCRSALPDAGAKASAWQSIMVDTSLSNRLLLATADGFWQPDQDDLTAGYVGRYFAELPAMANRRSPEVTWRLAAAAYPRLAVRSETVTAAQRLLDHDDLPAGLRRTVLDCTDDLRRALAVRGSVGG
ncbi:MAG: aminopeptidase [Micromonosporaceae bacterium]|nr:aminopeptidase [Micromonosporaceae bacterium]